MINEKKRKKIQIPKVYEVWLQYDQLVRSLHTKKPKKIISRRTVIRQFLKKLVVVAAGAFLTTVAFYFFINRNRLYNSGLNGLLQKFSQLLTGENNTTSYYLTYYGMGLASNLLIIFCLWFKFKTRLDIIGTAPFYVLFQVLWTLLFSWLKLENYLFKNFRFFDDHGTQLNSIYFLPYYVIVALIAAIIHTYGYSLIFRVQAAPGGFEIISAHFANKKKSRFSIAFLSKVFGYTILFLLTLIDFLQKRGDKSGFKGFLDYATDNPQLGATLTYILTSSLFMKWVFPREKVILLQIYSRSEEKRNRALRLLRKFFPSYYNVWQKKGRQEEVVYVTTCYLTGWNYFLLKPELQSTGKIYINETS
jgi:uncharacterized membrane-anchored protein YitT (DUF2179 family)